MWMRKGRREVMWRRRRRSDVGRWRRDMGMGGQRGRGREWRGGMRIVLMIACRWWHHWWCLIVIATSVSVLSTISLL